MTFTQSQQPQQLVLPVLGGNSQFYYFFVEVGSSDEVPLVFVVEGHGVIFS